MTKVKCNIKCKNCIDGICQKDEINLEELPYEGIFCTSWESKYK